MKEKLTTIPNIYTETPKGESVVIGVANGMLQIQNHDTDTTTVIGAGFIQFVAPGKKKVIKLED